MTDERLEKIKRTLKMEMEWHDEFNNNNGDYYDTGIYDEMIDAVDLIDQIQKDNAVDVDTLHIDVRKVIKMLISKGFLK